MKRCIVKGCRRSTRRPDWAVCDEDFRRMVKAEDMPGNGKGPA